DTGRPLTSTSITALDVTVCQPTTPTPRQTPANRTHPPHPARPANRPHAPATPSTSPRRPGRRPAVLTILRSTPGRAWPARHIARTLGVAGETGLNSFCVQMSQWARRGLLTKTAPATYMIT